MQNHWWLQCNDVCAAAPPQQVCAYEGTWATQVCNCDALSLVAVTGCCWSWTCPMKMSLWCSHVNGNKYCTVQQQTLKSNLFVTSVWMCAVFLLPQFALLFSESVHIDTLLTADLCTNKFLHSSAHWTLATSLSASNHGCYQHTPTFWVDFRVQNVALQLSVSKSYSHFALTPLAAWCSVKAGKFVVKLDCLKRNLLITTKQLTEWHQAFPHQYFVQNCVNNLYINCLLYCCWTYKMLLSSLGVNTSHFVIVSQVAINCSAYEVAEP